MTITMFNVDRQLMRTIFHQLKVIERNENYHCCIFPEKLCLQITEFAFDICSHLGVTNSTVFFTLHLFYKLVYVNGNDFYMIRFDTFEEHNIQLILTHLIACLRLAKKIDDDNDVHITKIFFKKILKGILQGPLFAKKFDWQQWKIENINIAEEEIIKKLNFNLILVTPIDFIDVYTEEILNKDKDIYNLQIMCLYITFYMSIFLHYPYSFPKNISPSKQCVIAIACSRKRLVQINKVQIIIWPDYAEKITGYSYFDIAYICRLVEDAILKYQIQLPSNIEQQPT